MSEVAALEWALRKLDMCVCILLFIVAVRKYDDIAYEFLLCWLSRC